MKYGYFDDGRQEYVITRPDTPAPWANYLGSPEYGALISNNAGGYSFAKSGANGRILRYVFNRDDQPGRYIYIRDNGDGDYWSASWQPVGKDLDGLRIAPSIPGDWKELEIEKDFRGRKLHIRIENPDGRESGCRAMTVNGRPVEGNYVPETMMTEQTQIVLTM
jgi:cellobiose phosphorylase